jgi:hypothetical protein
MRREGNRGKGREPNRLRRLLIREQELEGLPRNHQEEERSTEYNGECGEQRRVERGTHRASAASLGLGLGWVRAAETDKEQQRPLAG